MINGEFLEKMTEIALKTKEARVFRPDAEPDHIYLIQNGSGQIERCEAAPHPRHHEVGSLAALVTALELANKGAVIFYSRDGIVGIYSNDLRRDRVTVKVGLSPQILELQQITSKGGAQFTQRDMLRWFRNSMFGCLTQPSNVEDQIKNVKFESSKEATGVISKGKSSVGKQIQAQLVGAETLPDYLDMTVPIFANPTLQCRAAIKLSFEVDEHAEVFAVRTIPLSVEQAITEAEDDLGRKILSVTSRDDDPEFAKRFQVIYGKV